MQLTNPLEFLKLGGRVRYLGGVNDTYWLGADNSVIDNLKWLRKSLAELGFTVSQNLFDAVLAPRILAFEQKVAESDDPNITIGDDARSLAHDILDFERTVHAEALS